MNKQGSVAWIQNCFKNCFTKLFYKTVLQSCFTKLFYKAVLQSCFLVIRGPHICFFPPSLWREIHGYTYAHTHAHSSTSRLAQDIDVGLFRRNIGLFVGNIRIGLTWDVWPCPLQNIEIGLFRRIIGLFRRNIGLFCSNIWMSLRCLALPRHPDSVRSYIQVSFAEL